MALPIIPAAEFIVDKFKLIEMTLDQLLESFVASPESFEYQDKDYTPNRMCVSPTIIWQPRFELKDNSATVILDPNNNPNRTVVVTLNEFECAIRCHIFFKNTVFAELSGQKSDAYMEAKYNYFFSVRSNYKKFMQLKEFIIARDRQRENTDYLKKLSSIFPATVDDHLLR